MLLFSVFSLFFHKNSALTILPLVLSICLFFSSLIFLGSVLYLSKSPQILPYSPNATNYKYYIMDVYFHCLTIQGIYTLSNWGQNLYQCRFIFFFCSYNESAIYKYILILLHQSHKVQQILNSRFNTNFIDLIE